MKKIISLLIAVSMILLTSISGIADNNNIVNHSNIPYKQREFRVDTENADKLISEFKVELDVSGNWEKVFEGYKKLVNEYNRIYSVYLMAYMESYKAYCGTDTIIDVQTSDAQYKLANEYTYKILNTIADSLLSKYADDFREYWGEDKSEYMAGIKDVSESNIELEKLSKDGVDRYNEVITDTTMTYSEKSLECAKILKNVISKMNNYARTSTNHDNYIDYYYSIRNLGYGADDILKLCNSLSDYYYYVNKFKNYGISVKGLGDTTNESTFLKNSDELGLLGKYVGKISPEMQESYDYLVKNNLYIKGENDSINYGWTVTMPYYDDGIIFVSGQDRMKTLIHEFGHFNSLMNNKTLNNSEAYLFQQIDDMGEFDSQAFELISMDYYDDIYGKNGDEKKFSTLTYLLQSVMDYIQTSSIQINLYKNMDNFTAEKLSQQMTSMLGTEWYMNSKYFRFGNVPVNYLTTLFAAVQVYDKYIHDKDKGLAKYFEIANYEDTGNKSYRKIMAETGLVDIFADNAKDVLYDITEDIFETEYEIDYNTALDYFENGTYLGKVFPTVQNVSVNGGEIKKLVAYNSNGFNYIRMQDLAVLLKDTEAEFNVEYDADTYTVNIILNTDYVSDGLEMSELDEIKTAGMKASGTANLTINGQPTGFSQAIFVNNMNCYLLRGLSEKGILNIDVDFDEETHTVLLNTK